VSALRASRVTRFFVVPLTLVALFVGCHKWSEPDTPIDVFAREGDFSSRIRVTQSAGRRYELERPIVIRDTLKGWVDALQDTIQIALADVSKLEMRKTNWLTTGLLIYLGVGTVAFVACMATNDCGIIDFSDNGGNNE
jgi:hypothetical protein